MISVYRIERGGFEEKTEAVIGSATKADCTSLQAFLLSLREFFPLL